MHLRKTILILLFLSILSGLLPTVSLAHKIKLFAAVEDDQIKGYGYYPGGAKYVNGQVLVLSATGEQLAELTTDKAGEFSYRPKTQADHIFSITTKDGHKTSFTVSATEFASGPPPSSPVPRAQAKNSSSSATTADLEKMIEQAVAKQIAPLRAELNRQQEKTRLQDILGGLGYIMGLFGISAYFLARRKQK